MKTNRKAVLWLALAGLLCITACVAVRIFRTHDDAFTEQGLLKVKASDLAATVVTPHWELPVTKGKNILWCGSFQLAWNEACSLLGENLRFDSEPLMAGALNRKSFTRQDIDPESFVAVAGFVKDDIYGRITQQLEDVFEGQTAPRALPPPELTPRPQDLVVYSYLFKNLEFQVPFERIEKPVMFGTEEIPCFGIGEEYKLKHYELLQQFLIADYQGEDDFVVEFKTKSKRDRVILAKIQPEATLAATIKAVGKRAANSEPVHPRIGDVLKVPPLNFDITRRFGELEGRKLLHGNPDVANDLSVFSAFQNIRCQFNEKGVRLRSDSHMSFGCAKAPEPPATQHIMIFNKPFLIMLQGSDVDVPYFALWVGNPELLVKAEK